MTAVVKKSRGRPTLYREELCELAFKFSLLGATDKEMAEFFGITEATLYKWKAEKPEFSEAIKEGKVKADAQVAQSLYKTALDGNTTAQIFWLKNRSFRWSDRQEVNISGHTTSDVRTLGVLAVSDPEQLAKTCEALRLWQQQKNQLSEKPGEKAADAQASPSPLEGLVSAQNQSTTQNQPPRKQW